MPPLAAGSVPVTPVVRGSPVALVSVAAEGVPKLGVVNAGLFDRTTEPVPVDVVVPVPPEVTASAVPSVSEASELNASTTLVPSQYNTLYWPAGTAIPDPPEVFSVRANPPVVSLRKKYSLLTAGQMTFLASPGAPVATMNILRASSAAPSVLLRV